MGHARPSRLADMVGIGVDRMGDAADAASDLGLLRLENMDTDLRPHPAALEATRRAVDDDAANSYLPFPGSARLRRAAAAHVARVSGLESDWRRQCIVSPRGVEGVPHVLLPLLRPGGGGIPTPPAHFGPPNPGGPPGGG